MHDFKWWHTGVIYQIYPRSFKDSNADGVGDLRGIVEKLDYLQWLGINAIWISPIYPSPMADFGYDISDYKNIHPLFGTMDDFDMLLSEVHSRGMKMLLDLVPNHSSSQHPWFLESRSSRDSAKRNWYIWRDAKPDGSPPNNWLSVFGGPAWEWDPSTGQYYYHAFLKEQPDLNWRNPEVREAIFDVMRFWLDKGVDGFRVDVMWHMVKDEQLRDNPPNPEYQPYMADYEKLLPVYSTDQPEVHDAIREMRRLLDGYDDRMMIGEVYLPIHKLMTYYGMDNSGAHLPFNFQLISLPWEADKISIAVDEYEAALPDGAWPNWVLGNHDQARIRSRVGAEQARVAAMMLLTLRGTPTIYYGEELGMTDVAIPAEEICDPQGLNMPGKNLSRDPARTPMQWNDTKYAGFSEARPWLRLSPAYKRINVEAQKNDPHSFLSFYRRLIELRQSHASFTCGNFVPVFSNRQVMAYSRKAEGDDEFLIVLNLTHKPCSFELPKPELKAKIILSTSPWLEGNEIGYMIDLNGDEAFVATVSA